MTVRRGMADYRQAGAGGILFMGLLQAQGQEMTYEQRRILYRSMYSNEISKVEMDKKASQDERIIQLLKDTKSMLDTAGNDYKSMYEGKTYDTAENNYAELLAQILDNLWEVAIKAKLIESITVEQDAVG
jgi:hypothetical protein